MDGFHKRMGISLGLFLMVTYYEASLKKLIDSPGSDIGSLLAIRRTPDLP